MAKILELSSSVVLKDDIPVEVEYEDALISQYAVEGAGVTGDAVILQLGTKHTDCLAKEVCCPTSDGEACCVSEEPVRFMKV